VRWLVLQAAAAAVNTTKTTTTTLGGTVLIIQTVQTIILRNERRWYLSIEWHASQWGLRTKCNLGDEASGIVLVVMDDGFYLRGKDVIYCTCVVFLTIYTVCAYSANGQFI
jgi:hypothetical protein